MLLLILKIRFQVASKIHNLKFYKQRSSHVINYICFALGFFLNGSFFKLIISL